MKKYLGFALIGTMLFGLTGCGLKGPLYFPGDKTKPTTTTTQDSGHVEKNQQDSSTSSGI